jgi:hypothetical protein
VFSAYALMAAMFTISKSTASGHHLVSRFTDYWRAIMSAVATPDFISPLVYFYHTCSCQNSEGSSFSLKHIWQEKRVLGITEYAVLCFSPTVFRFGISPRWERIVFQQEWGLLSATFVLAGSWCFVFSTST